MRVLQTTNLLAIGKHRYNMEEVRVLLARVKRASEHEGLDHVLAV